MSSWLQSLENVLEKVDSTTANLAKKGITSYIAYQETNITR